MHRSWKPGRWEPPSWVRIPLPPYHSSIFFISFILDEKGLLLSSICMYMAHGNCRWRDSNPHTPCGIRDFKSLASAISPHRHDELYYFIIRRFWTLSFGSALVFHHIEDTFHINYAFREMLPLQRNAVLSVAISFQQQKSWMPHYTSCPSFGWGTPNPPIYQYINKTRWRNLKQC